MGDHKSHIRHEDTSHVGAIHTYGGQYIHVGDHMILIPYKVRGPKESYSICGGTI